MLNVHRVIFTEIKHLQKLVHIHLSDCFYLRRHVKSLVWSKALHLNQRVFGHNTMYLLPRDYRRKVFCIILHINLA
jgi:hypothetical protein